MDTNVNEEKFLIGQENAVDKGDNLAWLYKLTLAFAFALATGYAAQLKIFLPFTPVPITLQTFVVLASGILLGRWWGALSQILYVVCGAFGVPFFAGMAGGLGILVGPRGGYLIGFVLTAFFVGHLAQKQFCVMNNRGRLRLRGRLSLRGGLRLFFTRFLTITATYTILIYGLGVTQLGLWFWFAKGACPSLGALLMMGVVPFIPGDLIKIALVSLLRRRG